MIIIDMCGKNMLLTAISGSLGAAYLLWFTWRRYRRTTVKDKVVLITGASSGIGEACAHIFYKAGANIILCSRRESELQRVKAQLQALPLENVHPPFVLCLDLEDIAAIPKIAQQALDIHGHVDILINNGGISNRGDVVTTPIDVEMRVFRVNVFGTIALTKALLPNMIARQAGHIVVVSSIQGKFAIPNRACYGASKHAVQAYFDSLRAEICEENIHVSVINPSYVSTNIGINALTPTGEAHGQTSAAEANGMSSQYVALQIERAVTCRKNEVLLSPPLHTLFVYIRTLCPWIYYKVMEMRAKKERKHR